MFDLFLGREIYWLFHHLWVILLFFSGLLSFSLVRYTTQIFPYLTTKFSWRGSTVLLMTTIFQIPIALDMANSVKKRDEELRKRINQDPYTYYAVVECYQTLFSILDSLIVEQSDKKWVVFPFLIFSAYYVWVYVYSEKINLAWLSV